MYCIFHALQPRLELLNSADIAISFVTDVFSEYLISVPGPAELLWKWGGGGGGTDNTFFSVTL